MRPFMTKMSVWIFLLLAVFSVQSAMSAGQDKYKVAYLEAGQFWAFDEIMKEIQIAIDELGWKDRIEYPANARFSPGWGNKGALDKKAEKLMARKDIDLIISAGTDATGAILKANNKRTPILSIGVSDPIKSGFVANENDSGIDNYTARVQAGRYRRMFGIFHDVAHFKKLGLIYPDTESGRIYANVEDARYMGKERDFEVLEYKKLSDAETTEECLEGLRWLVSQGMDAFFIPPLNCFDWKLSDVRKPLNFLMEKKIPTFAREGTKYVKSGALMGFSSIDFSVRSKFIAEKIIKILEGKKPRSLPMADKATPRISLNLFVAERIGFTFSFDILGASDELFQEIILPGDRRIK